MEMLSRLQIPIHGARAVVVGDSNVVGLPMVLMLNAARATVACVHRDTSNPQEYTRVSDIVIAAAGVPGLVKKARLSKLRYRQVILVVLRVRQSHKSKLYAVRATFACVHRDTSTPQEYTRVADIVIAAVGVPGFAKKARHSKLRFFKPNSSVLHVR